METQIQVLLNQKHSNVIINKEYSVIYNVNKMLF